MAEYVAAAAGLAGVGFCDHLPFGEEAMADPSLAMARDELPRYVEEVLRFRDAAAVPVLLGIEADYIPGQEDRLAATLAPFCWDYVVGAVHVVGDWPVDYSRYADRFLTADVTALYRDYYRLVAKMAAAGLFDVWAHGDLPKKFGYRPREDVTDAEEEALAAVAAAGMVMEINTSGERKPAREFYPSPRLLRRARELGIPITFGSDAHAPAEVGYAFAAAVRFARAAGYEQYVTFSRRRRIFKPLAEVASAM